MVYGAIYLTHHMLHRKAVCKILLASDGSRVAASLSVPGTRKPIFPAVDDTRLVQRSVTLFKRQWRRLAEIASTEERGDMDALRYLLDWAMEEWETQRRRKSGPSGRGGPPPE